MKLESKFHHAKMSERVGRSVKGVANNSDRRLFLCFPLFISFTHFFFNFYYSNWAFEKTKSIKKNKHI